MEMKINTNATVEGIDTSHGTVMMLLPDGSLSIRKIKRLEITV